MSDIYQLKELIGHKVLQFTLSEGHSIQDGIAIVEIVSVFPEYNSVEIISSSGQQTTCSSDEIIISYDELYQKLCELGEYKYSQALEDQSRIGYEDGEFKSPMKKAFWSNSFPFIWGQTQYFRCRPSFQEENWNYLVFQPCYVDEEENVIEHGCGFLAQEDCIVDHLYEEETLVVSINEYEIMASWICDYFYEQGLLDS